MPRLYRSTVYTLDHDIVSNMLRLVRAPGTFNSAAEFEQEWTEIEAALKSFPLSKVALLIDNRAAKAAPPDSELDAAFMRCTQNFLSKFKRCAILNDTPVGMLQTKRINRESKGNLSVFRVEQEALDFLLGS